MRSGNQRVLGVCDSGGGAKLLEELRLEGAERHRLAVLGEIRCVRRAAAGEELGATGRNLAAQKTAERDGGEGNHRVEHGDVENLSLAGALAFEERGHDADDGEERARYVGGLKRRDLR